MRVLLVNPYWDHLPGKKGPVYSRRFPPVELANIASLLRGEGMEVELVDANASRLVPSALGAFAARADRVFVSSSNLDRWCCPNVDIEPFLLATRALRENCPRTVILGAHPTAWPESLLQKTGAWAAIVGEPETTALDLARCEEPLGIAGAVVQLPGGGFRRGPAREPLDLDALPTPAYDLLPRGAYRYEPLGSDLMVFEMTRGCPYTCRFCHKALHGARPRMRGVERLMEDLERARATCGTRSAYFMDLEFTLDRDATLRVNEALRSRGNPVEWCCQTRVDLVDRALLADMKSSGCSLVHFGIEAGSQAVLDAVGKKTTIEQARRAVRLAREVGLRTACFFLFGIPGESRADMLATIRLARTLAPTYASFHMAIPYPHTPLARSFGPQREGEFPSHFAGHWSHRELQAWVRLGFGAFYLRPRAVWSTLREGRISDLSDLASVFWWYVS